MYQALYRKYRPVKFEDVVGQEHITGALKGSLQSSKISHAYLFTGTRGTGKTTCAKILAKAVCCEAPVNGEPCGKCPSCISIAQNSTTDISEIDAASNNSVNDIRDLREQVNFLPSALKYKVYIIDEVHMLSSSAFNALLKTLEEPPAHVIFILATTEVHKLPATILSRCQRYDFRRLEPDVIAKRIDTIAKAEGFTVTDGAKTMIASLADGGMRDALSILDQCSSCSNSVTEEVIADICGIAGTRQISRLIGAIAEKNAAEALGIVDELYRNSVDMKKLLFETVSYFRNLMIIQTVKDCRNLIVCSEDGFKEMQALSQKFTLSEILDCLSLLQTTGEASGASCRSDVELIIVRLCTPELSNSLSALAARIEKLEKAVELKGSSLSSASSTFPSNNSVSNNLSSNSNLSSNNSALHNSAPYNSASINKTAPAQNIPLPNGYDSSKTPVNSDAKIMGENSGLLHTANISENPVPSKQTTVGSANATAAPTDAVPNPAAADFIEANSESTNSESTNSAPTNSASASSAFDAAQKSKAQEKQKSGEPVFLNEWPDILDIVKKSCPLMAGVLVGSRAYLKDGRILIDSKLEQFKDLINSDAKYRDYIKKAAEEVLGASYNLGPYRPPAKAVKNTVDPLEEFAKSLENLE